MRCLRWLLLMGVVAALASPAKAITLQIGDVEFWIEDRDNGTVYTIPGGKGTSIGVTNNPVAGVAALDGLPPPPGANAILPAGGMVGANWAPWALGTSEDSWGIAKTNLINGPSGTTWFANTASTELVWVFYGAEDFYSEISDGLGGVTTASVGLRAELWEEPTSGMGVTPLTFGQGSNNRTGLTTYTGVTEGTMLLQLQSVPGFIRAARDFGGPATEFETTFNAGSFTGGGVAFFKITGGTMAGDFDQATIWTAASQANGVPNCDAKAVFDSWSAIDGPNPSGFPTGPAPYDWLVETGGQYFGNYVPEPLTMAGLLLGVGSLVGYVRTRK